MASVSVAQGKYVAFLDSDDEFLPNKLERCLPLLEREPNMAVYSQTFVDRGVSRMWVKPARGLRDDEDIFEYLLLHKLWVHPSTIVLQADDARTASLSAKTWVSATIRNSPLIFAATVSSCR